MKICFVVNEERYFISHRLLLAEKALEKGWDVILVSLPSAQGIDLEVMGIKTIAAKLDRGGLNPLKDFAYFRQLHKIYRSEKPDLVHHVTLKSCLYGSIAAWTAGVKNVVNAIAGLGSIVTSKSMKIRLVRPFIMMSLRILFGRKNSELILQNEDDVRELAEVLKLRRSSVHLTRGSGVDMDQFKPGGNSSESDIPLVVMVSRLLIEKGVYELIEAARILKDRGIQCRIALVGEPDPENPHSVPQEELDDAQEKGLIENWGLRNDVPEVYQKASVAVLPSFYREGIPKSLLEAAASGVPIVTTDAPGCREVVDEGVNGFIVPVREALPLADALGKLILSSELRKEMGRKSREKALREFDVERVVEQTFQAYYKLVSAK